ncbi:unnamed protein product [Echinostoma caproni]|uniref:Protein kinase domain-containing protein n=1 Tax=Echinostoma caproni TaxID=27848 RepID=A0A183B2C2_9TREM|nr:unnamed protein product [Echinostoma caproni]
MSEEVALRESLLAGIPHEWEIPCRHISWDTEKPLGQGSFGTVFLGRMLRNSMPNQSRVGTMSRVLSKFTPDNKDSTMLVAVKTVGPEASADDIREFLSEAAFMKNFSCHHIVRMLGITTSEQPLWHTPPALVMEWMALGDLASYLRQRERRDDCSDGVVKPKLALTWAAQIADGMLFLSDRNLVHRDLAARNCLVDKQLTVKIADFGLARCMSADEYYRRRGQTRLPIRWMAPESLNQSYFTTKSDVWSYGIVLWEIATFAALPYSGLSHEQVIAHVTQGGYLDLRDLPARLPSVL